MSDELAGILGWVVPALIVFGSAAVLAALGVWALRRARRSPRARAAAEADRQAAGVSLVRLDDAVAELDLEVGLSGAMSATGAPASLRRARVSAQHVRDDAFEQFRLLDADTLPCDVARVARGIRTRADSALAATERARAEHEQWTRAHVSAADQVAAARERCAALRAQIGDPTALLAELSERFDRGEWVDAERACTEATTQLSLAERLLDEAALRAADPTGDALAPLADAERALQRAERASRQLEERHRLLTDAAGAVTGELAGLDEALRHAIGVGNDLEPDAATRLSGEVRQIGAALEAERSQAARHPMATVDRVARLRDRLDLALGDARTAQQRLRGARTALPGAMASARDALSRAETRVAGAGADARVRWSLAQRELVSARNAGDPVEALDAARRALRYAEDAVALADYDALTGK